MAKDYYAYNSLDVFKYAVNATLFGTDTKFGIKLATSSEYGIIFQSHVFFGFSSPEEFTKFLKNVVIYNSDNKMVSYKDFIALAETSSVDLPF